MLGVEDYGERRIMLYVKINKRNQITIPKEIRYKAGIEKGDRISVEYDQRKNTIKLIPTKRRNRRNWKFGSKLTVKLIEEAIEVGKAKC